MVGGFGTAAKAQGVGGCRKNAILDLFVALVFAFALATAVAAVAAASSTSSSCSSSYEARFGGQRLSTTAGPQPKACCEKRNPA